MNIKQVVIEEISKILTDKGQMSSVIQETNPLGNTGLGLDSLDMATLIAQLDARLHYDPFADQTPNLVTVHDLIVIYKRNGAS